MIERFERWQVLVVDILTLIAPWFASIPSAWALGAGAVTEMSLPLPVAVALGLTFLTLDPVLIYGALALRRYNQVRPAGMPPAPLGMAGGILGVYVALTMALMALLQHGHPAMLALPPLGLLAMAAMVLHRDHRARVADAAAVQQVETERSIALQRLQHEHDLALQAQRYAQRRQNRLDRREAALQQPAQQPETVLQQGDTRQRVLQHYLEHPQHSTREAASALQLSSATVSRWLRRLEGEGEIRRNGEVTVVVDEQGETHG